VRIYWRLKDIPELGGLSSREQREAWRACHNRALGHWQFWLAVAAGLACGVVIADRVWGATGGGIGAGIHGGITGGIGGFVWGQAAAHTIRPHLRDYVAAHFPAKAATPPER
jgi:hypothetical protein